MNEPRPYTTRCSALEYVLQAFRPETTGLIFDVLALWVRACVQQLKEQDIMALAKG